VRANPEPDDLIRRSSDANRTVTAADADRNEPIRSMNLLETQTRVPRVRHKLTICRAGLTADIVRERREQLPKAGSDVRIHNNWSGSSGVVKPRSCSFRASSANRSRALPGLPNSSPHRRSDSISASNQAPIASWSLSGSFAASEIAFSSSLPIAIHSTNRSDRNGLTAPE
jgi:hypothetical protein